MRIDVWSDVVCPWCYLGKRRLEGALAGVDGGDDVEVRWRAYQLDPAAGREPKPLGPALERKYGPGAYEGMKARLVPLGREVGIDYRFDDIQRVSSVDAMRLLAWAAEQADGGTVDPGVVDRLEERLFHAYFTEAANIADRSALAGWAADVGLDRELAAEALAGDAHLDTVRADVDAAHQLGISGVPSFLLGGSFLVPGAQDVDTLRQLIERARERIG